MGTSLIIAVNLHTIVLSAATKRNMPGDRKPNNSPGKQFAPDNPRKNEEDKQHSKKREHNHSEEQSVHKYRKISADKHFSEGQMELVHSFGASATLTMEKVSGCSNDLKQDKVVPHHDVSPRQIIQKNDQSIHKTGESIAQEREPPTVLQQTPFLHESLLSTSEHVSTGVNHHMDQPIHKTGESIAQGREPPTGLYNIGNTCYANSLLQVVRQTPFLHERLFSTSEHVSTSENHHLKTTVTSAFRNFLLSMKSDTYENSGPIATLMNIVSRKVQDFRIGFQNDCHSFLLTLLSELHDENKAKDTTQIFEIKMVDEFAFESCEHKEITDIQIMRSLTIPSESFNVEEGLKTLLYEEEFDEADVPCRECKRDDKCAREGKTRKTMRFHTLPKILVLQLGCFKEISYGGHLHIEKSSKRIGFPEKLTVSQSSRSSVPYHLYGVVNHHGSVYGGHYTSFVKHHSDTGHWYYCNDSHVRHSTILEALKSPDAYLLFYTI